MKKLIIIITIMFTFVMVSQATCFAGWEDELKLKYNPGTITMSDPRMFQHGNIDSEKAHMDYTVVDLSKYFGHICGGSSAGFIMTKILLERLHPNGEIPVKGDIKLTSNIQNKPMQVFAYITGIWDHKRYGEWKYWKIDKSIAEKGMPRQITMIAERISTGKKVKIVWNKGKDMKRLIKVPLKEYRRIKKAVEKGTASDAEKIQRKELLQPMIKSAFNGGHTFIITELN